MKKMLKHSLSIMLAVIMAMGATPLAGFVGFEMSNIVSWFAIKAEAATYSGSCGDNLIWSLDTDTGKLIISGTGAMDDYSYSYSSYKSAPWYAYRSYIKTISLSDSITSIGSFAFYACEHLSDITVSKNLTRIGDSAFYGCDSLASITMCNGITSIGASAFRNCSSLTSIIIPGSVTNLGDHLFIGCAGLTSIAVDTNNQYYSSGEDGVLFNKDKTTLIQYPIGNTKTSYLVPDSVVSINEQSFSGCNNLTSITIPDSVTSIGVLAFRNTGYYNNTNNWENDVLYIGKHLIEAQNTISGSYEIKEGILNIADSAFSNCTGLTSITIPNSVINIGNSAFYCCDSLTSITIPDSVISIGDSSFSNCDNLINVTFGNSLTSMGDFLFYACSTLESVIIPDSVISMGESTFYHCSGLTSATIGNGVTKISDSAFLGCHSLTNLTIGNGVTSIGNSAFYYCDSLTSITIPNSVKSIGSNAFEDCINLMNITIGNGITNIGERVFIDCSRLTDVYYTGDVAGWCSIDFNNYDSNPMYHADNLYINGQLVSDKLTIPDNVTRISDYAFYNFDSLKSIIIPDSIISIGDMSFYKCTGLTDVYYTGDIAEWCSIDFGGFYSNTMYYADNLYIAGEVVSGELTIPNSVTCIGDFAFYKCTDLTNITIPDSVTNIGDYTFEYCTGLTSITIPDSVTSIGSSAFFNCNSLKNVTIGNSVTNISNSAFYDCSNINTTYYTGTQAQWNKIIIGSNNTYLTRNIIFESNSEGPYYGGVCGDNLFWKLYADGELVITGTGDMTDYTSYSSAPWYSKRSKITSVNLSDGLTSIGDYAFKGTNITSLTIPKSVTFISSTNLSGLSNLTKIIFEGYDVEFASGAFDSCNADLVIYCKSGSSVQSYAEQNGRTYVLTDGIASDCVIQNNVLVSYEGNLASPIIPNSITSIGSSAFKDNTTVKNIEIPYSVTAIFSGAFSNCTSLERVIIPHTVTTIASNAFDSSNATIVCFSNSYAHKYAVENKIDYELIAVELSETQVVLVIGETSTIIATPAQTYVSDVDITWKINDEDIATVSEDGVITAVSRGKTTLFALAPNGQTFATCSITVNIREIDAQILKPTTTTISYGDSIILHIDTTNIPVGGSIEWTTDNDNFTKSIASDSSTCTISPSKSGSTIFTAIVYDANGNVISTDTQIMTSKAGFFDKLIAFFKRLFGLTKTIPQAFKGIF